MSFMESFFLFVFYYSGLRGFLFNINYRHGLSLEPRGHAYAFWCGSFDYSVFFGAIGVYTNRSDLLRHIFYTNQRQSADL